MELFLAHTMQIVQTYSAVDSVTAISCSYEPINSNVSLFHSITDLFIIILYYAMGFTSTVGCFARERLQYNIGIGKNRYCQMQIIGDRISIIIS